ncbi:MAG: hypothetical protein H7831_04835 [Magnetococcus sp. WYHC-3]
MGLLAWLERVAAVVRPIPAAAHPMDIRHGTEAVSGTMARAITVREVDAGSCNGCELEIHAMNGPRYDAERFGVHFTASPRHADLLLVTGPVARNMEVALRMTHAATPGPKKVVAVGDCAAHGGVFGCSYASAGGVERVIPVDVVVHGCPPPPGDILRGILAAMGREP